MYLPTLDCGGTTRNMYCKFGKAVKAILNISFMAVRQYSSRAAKKQRKRLFIGCTRNNMIQKQAAIRHSLDGSHTSLLIELTKIPGRLK